MKGWEISLTFSGKIKGLDGLNLVILQDLLPILLIMLSLLNFNLKGCPLKTWLNSLASSTFTFQKDTKGSIKNLENQVGQLASEVNQIKAQLSKKLPSKPFNPMENASVVTKW